MRNDYAPSSPARSLNSWASPIHHPRGSSLNRFHFERATAVFRFIERGTLRTFGGHSAGVSAFFSGFICIFMYLLWWYIGEALSAVITIPNRCKGAMGLPNVANLGLQHVHAGFTLKRSERR